MRKRLTDSAVRAISPRPKGRLFVYDTTLQGFGLTVFPTGTKTWFVEYGPRGRRKRMSIGRWPKMNAGLARRIAKETLGKIAGGADPARERKEERAREAEVAKTFGWWVDQYLEEVEGRKKRPDHDRSHLSRAKVRWKQRPLTSITSEDVRAAMAAERKRAAKSKRASGRDGALPGATTANRWLASVSACFTAAWEAGLIQENPCTKVKKFREAPPRARVLDSEELARLIPAIEQEPDPYAKAAFRLLLETGCRLSEALNARWEDLELDRTPPLWRIPSPKSGRPQVVPLHPRTAAMLADLKRVGEYVIAGRHPDRPRSDLKRAWADLKARADLPQDVHIHDLRRTYGLHVAQRAGLHVASKLLRHGDVRITEQVYAPLGMEDLARAVEKAGTPGDVVDISEARRRSGEAG